MKLPQQVRSQAQLGNEVCRSRARESTEEERERFTQPSAVSRRRLRLRMKRRADRLAVADGEEHVFLAAIGDLHRDA